ncbi:ATP-binding protein [Hyalangium minutum]|uniref:histidine kinase n=1 Tax=Hyalangium minutum TaxID=394096 RepID=A0A085W782_9BACT|nr:ATP-binding protein [Hyalangium minutum]KFE63545.1 Sensory box histidine kinase [Hyalangium minutum]
MGERIRQHDWSSSGLGPPETWPLRLQGYTDMILRMPTPAIIFWGPEQTQIYNAGYAIIMGPRHPRYLGASYRECWPDTYPTIYPWMRRVLDEGEVIQVDKTLIPVTRHGFTEEAYFTFSFVPLRDDDGRINGFLQPVNEVTEEVIAERRLATLRAIAPRATTHAEVMQETAAAFRGNAQDLPFAVLYLWNDAVHTLDLAVHHGLEMIPEPLRTAGEQVFASGEASKVEDFEALLGRSHTGPWPEPTRSAMILPLRRSPAHAAGGVLVLGISPRLHFDEKYQAFFEAVARELAAVIEQQRAQQALRESEALLRTTFASLAEGISLQDADGTIRFSNTAAERLLGLTADQLSGRTSEDSRWHAIREDGSPFPGEEHPPMVALRTGQPQLGKVLGVRRSDGSLVWLAINALPLPGREDGSPGGVVSSFFDITERKAAEARIRELNATLERRVAERTRELEEANRELEAFSYSVSHDLRAPLRHITGFVQLLDKRARSVLDAKSQEFLKTIAEAAQRGGQLVDDLLDFSRMSRAEMRLASVSLGSLVEEVRRELLPDVEGRRVTWKVEALPAVHGDAALLRLVFRNLLSNAIKYTRTKPEAVIEIFAHALPEETEVVVRDNGVGFEMEFVGKLFGVFQRLHSVEEFEGTGIGLANVRRVVHRHGGRVWAEGVPGQGATFHFTLPLSSR